MGKESKKTKYILISTSLIFLIVMLLFPLTLILVEALKKGIDAYFKAVTDNYTFKALNFTILATLIATILNTIFGVIAAWAITKFDFKGKNFLTTLIDLPFAISPVIAGLIFILAFGRGGLFESLITKLDMQIVFALPGVILATVFVTFPFVAREVIPLMHAQGKSEEEAAALMGASGFRIFRKITFPNIKWGLVYGVILCAARAMGEFGAVSVVSGHIRGQTNTLPLHVEILYSEYQFSAAFAVASILVILAVIILVLRNLIELKMKKGA